MAGLESFNIEQKDNQYRPEAMHTFGMYLNKKWYKLEAKADLIVDEKVIVELKSVERVKEVHKKQLLTYLKLGNYKLGYLLNFIICIDCAAAFDAMRNIGD